VTFRACQPLDAVPVTSAKACQPLDDAVPVTVAKAFARALATTWDTDVATAVELACELPPV